MKKSYLNILAVPLLAFAVSCSGTGETGELSDSATEPLEESEFANAENEVLNDGEVDYGNLFTEVDNTQQYDVFTLAKTDDDLSTFVALVEKAGLESSLAGSTPITVFIPTNEAFRQLSEEELSVLNDPQNKDRLIKLIKTHMMPAEVPSKHFTNSKVMETSSGESIAVDVDQDGTIVNIGGADVVKADVEVSNGIIHVVDAVFEPREFSDVGID